MVSSLSFTGTATEVWLGTNIPPVAVCQDVTVSAGSNCQAIVTAAQVDNGSSDPDGAIVSRVLSPSGPYSLGATPVTLTVTDDRGATNSCSATITVLDQTPPVVTCPGTVVTNVAFGITSVVVNYPAPVATDNCSLASTNSSPPSGSTFGLGTNAVTFIAVDGAGNTNSCVFDVIVNQSAPQTDLAVSEISSVSTASLNNSFAFTFVVTNQGPQTVTNTVFNDVLPGGVSYNASTSSVGSCVFTNGAITCDLGALTNGSSATVAVIVTTTSSNQICNTGSVSCELTDPVATNNSATVCVPVVIENLAVTAFKAPKKVTLSDKKPSVTSKLSVTIQNRSLHSETITNLNELASLVTIGLTPLGTNVCSVPEAQVVPPKAFPITLTSGKSLNIAYTITFTCANDPLATTKTANHNDYQYLASVNHAVLDGLRDSRQADDTCPHDALGVDPYNPKIKDKGCGIKNRDGTFGPVVTDIVDTRTRLGIGDGGWNWRIHRQRWRKPSLRRLKARTVQVMARPGAMQSQGAMRKVLCSSRSIMPHSGTSGWPVNPRNASPAASRTALPSVSVVNTRIRPAQFGRISNAAMRQRPAPVARAAKTYSLALSDRNAART